MLSLTEVLIRIGVAGSVEFLSRNVERNSDCSAYGNKSHTLLKYRMHAMITDSSGRLSAPT